MTTSRENLKQYRKLYEQAMSGTDRTAAIRMSCIECMEYNESAVWGCTDPDCPLYLYRMGPIQMEGHGGPGLPEELYGAPQPTQRGGDVLRSE